MYGLRRAVFAGILFCAILSVGPAELDARATWDSKRAYTVIHRTTVPRSVAYSRDLKLWIPLATSADGQEILTRVITPSQAVPYQITKDAVHGNEMVYFELADPLEDNLSIEIRYSVRSNERFRLAGGNGVEAEELGNYLRPSRLMVIDDTVKDIARKVTGSEATTLAKARAIYDYVIKHMRYEKETPGWGQGDTARACRIGAGNCTDFHSLFISVAIASQIPARFQIGLQLPEGEGTVPGYHCWAQFYDESQGWLTVDASEAWKHPELKDHYFGGFDVNKFQMTMGRDIALVPRQENGPINFFFYPYAEVDGRIYGGVQTEFYYQDVNPNEGEEVS